MSGAPDHEVPEQDGSDDGRSGHGSSEPAASDPGSGEDETEDQAIRARRKKAPNAFRTISEVADDLHIPQHVLRFWETRFTQVKPLKRGGGRRYYRPDDIDLLRRIADLLYTQGYTIKGVQRLLREGGGQLSDDIPPPAEHERAREGGEAADDPSDSPSLPDSARAFPQMQRGVGQNVGTQANRIDPEFQAAGDDEAERLRAVLIEILDELQELRALLGR